MTQKSQPMSTFAIRFNPASVVDDDDDDDELCNFKPIRPRKEVLQFERRSISPKPCPESTTSPAEVQDTAVTVTNTGNEQPPASHPSTLWKSPLHAVRSAPPSETTSPVSPMKTNTPSESDKNVVTRDTRPPGVTGGKDDFQKSIFSEWRDRLVNQSREILPNRLNKTGSADGAKIVTTQTEDEKTPAEKEMKVIKSRSRPGSDAGEALAKEILKSGSTEFLNGEWETLDDEGTSVKRSSSTGQISSKHEFNADDETATKKDLSVGNLAAVADVVSMSGLMSAASKESINSNFSDAVLEKPPSPKKLSIGEKSGDVRRFSQRIKRLQYVSKVPNLLKKPSFLALLALILSLVLPLPSFISGFATGCIMTASFAVIVYFFFLAPSKEKSQSLKSLPPLMVPEMKESKNSEGSFKGWMNELSEYDVDDFHINKTHSVFVTLEGSTMRLQTPKQGIAKRAMWDENIPGTVSFVRQKHYDLRGCQVNILPPDLIEKRLWSKKYPICLEIFKRVQTETHDKTGREVTRKSDPELSTSDLQMVMKSSPARKVDKPTTSDLVKCLYLFARSSREKEEWFRRFVAASAGTPWPTRMSDLLQKKNSKSHMRSGSISSIDNQLPHHKRNSSIDSQCSSISLESLPSPETEIDYAKLAPEKNLLEYMSYMANIIPAGESISTQTAAPSGTTKAPNPAPTQSPSTELCDPQLLFLNAVISRCFLDFLREKYWTNKIRDKIQKKLCKMHVPHFIDQLTVTGIELGPQVPVIYRTSKPYLDDRGLWVDLDISYAGGFGITMETKCNLMKLKSTTTVAPEEKQETEKRSGALYSDEEDSAESTTDEEAVEENSMDDANLDRRSEPISKKLLKFVDKISKSRYFQQATDYRYIKKAMEEVSNTRLILNVEMKSVVGTLAVNIPPPPTNRIWYGFRGNPNLVLSAKPKVGEREVSLSHITDWIEKKLAIEFQRVFVMPNMDDIPIPLMCEHLPSPPVAPTTV